MQKQGHVSYLKDSYNVSHAWACKVMQVSRTSKYYAKKMPSRDMELKAILEQVIGCSRKGREKVIRLVKKKHPQISGSKIRRVYEQEGFSLYRRLRRRVKHQPANPITIPLVANEEWAADFMSDTLENGRTFRSLNVVDHYNRACKGIALAHSLPATRVIEHLERMIEAHGKPKRIRTDNGPEFRSRKFQAWMKDQGIQWSPIQNGKPQQNAIVERFNKTFREDILDAHLFASIQQAQQLADEWRQDYNQTRPHQALNYLTPLEYAA
jgi:putative transposase